MITQNHLVVQDKPRHVTDHHELELDLNSIISDIIVFFFAWHKTRISTGKLQYMMMSISLIMPETKKRGILRYNFFKNANDGLRHAELC